MVRTECLRVHSLSLGHVFIPHSCSPTPFVHTCPFATHPCRRQSQGRSHNHRLKATRYKSRMTLFWIAWEVALSCLMLASVAVWFTYSIELVQNDAFSTR